MLDSYIKRLQNLEPFNINSVSSDGDVSAWYNVTGPEIVADLVLNDQNVGVQVQAIAAQVAHWARMAAQAKRVWESEERNYRIWRSRTWLAITKRPTIIPGTTDYEEKEGWGRTSKNELKPPTKEQAEALYRVDPEYVEWQNRVERAEEAFTSADGILDAFKAKRDMIKSVVWRNRDTGQPELVV